MCLTLKKRYISQNVQIAEKNIKVYKRFKRYTMFNGDIIIRTPYIGMNISSDGDIMVAPKFEYAQYWGYKTQNWVPNCREITTGIHAYTNLTKAKASLNYNEIIVECIIPEGTPYMIGDSNDIVSLVLIVPPINNWDKKLQCYSSNPKTK